MALPIRFWSKKANSTAFTSREEWLATAYLDKDAALIEAIEHNDFSAVSRMLIGGADPNCRDQHNRSPLQVAVMGGCEDIACSLLDAGAHVGFGMPRLLLKTISRVAKDAWDCSIDDDSELHSNTEEYITQPAQWLAKRAPTSQLTLDNSTDGSYPNSAGSGC
jgi:ankyrin repeat protein